MLPVWIVYASNFDLNIPECHIRDSSLSLYIFNSIGAQYHDMKLSLYRYRYVSQIPTRVCAIYSRVQKKVNVAYRNYYVITDRSTNCYLPIPLSV